MVAGVFIFSIMDALMKRMSVHYPPLEVSCLRSVSSFVCLLAIIAWQGSWATLEAAMPVQHLMRAALGILMLASFVFAVHRMTLAQTYSLFLAAPLLMTALSVPLLGEKVATSRWLAIMIGLSGVLVVLKPWGHGFASWAAVAAASAATIAYSLSALMVRNMSRRNSNMSMVFWYLALVGVGSGALAYHEWRAVELGDWGWLAGIGVSGALGQFWLTDAFKRAPPSVVAPFEYTAILWAFAIDWIFWSAVPSIELIAGGAIVVASGLYVIWDERRAAEFAVGPASTPP